MRHPDAVRGLIGLAVVAVTLVFSARAADTIILTPKVHHLGTPGDPEWDEFAGSTPEGRRLELRFTAQATTNETTLLFRQQDVKLEWGLELNGKSLGRLFQMESDLVQALAVHPGILKDGTNTLVLVPPRERDDIRFGPAGIDPRPVRGALHEVTLTLRTVDAADNSPLPCRFTIVDEEGPLFPAMVVPGPAIAARPGVIYSADGIASLGLRAGNYSLYASRGPEYSVQRQRVVLQTGQRLTYQFALTREVGTEGWVASDLHVHTLSHSGHGDATAEERMVTLAGEGIEVAVATEHNKNVDYSAARTKTGLEGRFTTVIGNEVTTAAGHFNIWPVAPEARVADFRIADWPRLMQELRSIPGVQVVVLNHPRNVHNDFQPFGPKLFNPVTGENRRGFDFSFDAVEVLSSSALQSDWMVNFRDWFALLNYGYRVAGVGVSDGHDVSRYVIGQGRTYVQMPAGNPGAIDIGEFARQLKAGRCLISMGLLTRMTVDDRYQVGDLATKLGELIRVTVTVSGPSWAQADRVELYGNGLLLRMQEIDSPVNPVEKTKVTWILPRPAHDMHLIAIASGPAVTESFWAIAKPYQPSSRTWQPRVVGATNPIWVDGDGDGRFTPAREAARQLVEKVGTSPGPIIAALAGFDQATTSQAAAICRARGAKTSEFEASLRTAPPHVRRGFEEEARGESPR